MVVDLSLSLLPLPIFLLSSHISNSQHLFPSSSPFLGTITLFVCRSFVQCSSFLSHIYLFLIDLFSIHLSIVDSPHGSDQLSL